MTHEEARELLVDLAYGELAEAAAAEVRAHIGACEACREEWSRIGLTLSAVRRVPRDVPPEHGEAALFAAAQEAAERMARSRLRRRSLTVRLAATAAAALAVGGLSFRLLARREASGGLPQAAVSDLAPADRATASGARTGETERGEGQKAAVSETWASKNAAAVRVPSPGREAASEARVAGARAAAAPAAQDQAPPPAGKGAARGPASEAAEVAAEVDGLVAGRALRIAKARTRPCGDGVAHLEAWADADGRTRLVAVEIRDGASPRSIELLYDPAGMLRLARVRGGARAVSLDAEGRRVLEEVPVPAPWPEAELPRRAQTALDDFSCP
ncbi:MAG TPA: zf-HC2 domain-containing protein [Anaeromyxobacteraceae bacterium]|nr:zf-HC2 domain-containing protein [Anaeromyxobacteraceae bacterium]